MNGPDWLYLHGFASGPSSTKGRAFAAWAEARGMTLHRLDLRVPSFEELRFSAMVEHVRAAIDGVQPDLDPPERRRAVLIGSSLGGLTACHVAQADPRVAAVFLMAPAFRLAERWRARLGEAEVVAWREHGWREVADHARGGTSRIGWGFFEELERIDAACAWPDVRVPVCIVHGVRDDVVDIEVSRAWAKGKRHVRLVEVDDTHELTASIPRILMEAEDFFATFLGKLAGSTG